MIKITRSLFLALTLLAAPALAQEPVTTMLDKLPSDYTYRGTSRGTVIVIDKATGAVVSGGGYEYIRFKPQRYRWNPTTLKLEAQFTMDAPAVDAVAVYVQGWNAALDWIASATASGKR